MKKILDEVKGAGSIAISGHIRPDGDCVGSCMGLYLYLTKELPNVDVDVFLEKPSDVFNCIQGVEQIKDASLYQEEVYDVFLALDCSKDRLGDAEVIYDHAKKTINIDHHISNTGAGMVNATPPPETTESSVNSTFLTVTWILRVVLSGRSTGLV